MKKILILAFAALSSSVFAQNMFVNFETDQGYNASAAGVILSGQNGWTMPAGVDTTCNTYAGNAYLSSTNNYGGAQFQQGVYNANFARAQKDYAWAREKKYSFGGDINFKFIGDPGTHVSNIQSISTQPGGNEQLIILSAYWGDETNPDLAAAYDVLFTNTAAQIYYPLMEDQSLDPSAAYNDAMSSDRWYARYNLIDMPRNHVDLSLCVDLENYRHYYRLYDAENGYLTSGDSALFPVPTAIRLFTGGGTGTSTTIGNLSAADNLSLFTNDVTVSGTMNYQDTDVPSEAQRVEFFDPNTGALKGTAATIVANGDGGYTVNAPGNGVYCMSIKHSHFLRQTVMIDTSLGSISGVNYSLVNGDCDGDNEVTLVDAGLISALFGLAVGDVGYDPMVDLNDDGEINLVDYGIMSARFGQAGDDVCL